MLSSDKLTLLLDLDGVLANFTSLYLEIVNDVLGMQKPFTAKDVTQWDIGKSLALRPRELERVHEVLFSRGAALRVPLYEGARVFMDYLLPTADVWFVTAPMRESPTWVFDRQLWVHEHFPEMSKKTIFAIDKRLVRGDIFVDDKPDNLAAWASRNPQGVPVIWDHIYNQSSTTYVRMSKWGEVIALVDKMTNHRKRPNV